MNDAADTLKENAWTAQVNIFGLWIVGPSQPDGTMNVIGMGRTFREAVEMAERSTV